MAKITLICGKICSGKSYIAGKIEGVILNCDELMTTLFPEPLGDAFDEMGRRAESYLMNLAETLTLGGVNVILDWGFWTRDSRNAAIERFRARGIETELIYVEPSERRRLENIALRNAAFAAGEKGIFEADEGLLEKCDSRFEPPAPPEVFTLIRNE